MCLTFYFGFIKLIESFGRMDLSITEKRHAVEAFCPILTRTEFSRIPIGKETTIHTA